MKQIRKSIFETNSSSTHSISFSFKKCMNNLKINIKNNGTVLINGIDQRYYLNRYEDIVSGESNKLNYIFSWMFLRDNGGYCADYDNYENSETEILDIMIWPNDLECCQNSDQYKNILEAINRKYTETEAKEFVLLNGSRIYFDHQTSPWERDSIVNLDDSDEIYKFLFNDHLYIEIGHD